MPWFQKCPIDSNIFPESIFSLLYSCGRTKCWIFFLALGLAQEIQQPVAVCCTSGTALLNLGPAVAEAYYQQVPLLVISADTISIMDRGKWMGNLPQPGVFNSLVKQSIQLLEPDSEEDEWYCKRMIHDAIFQLMNRLPGPSHINIPLSEPLFDFSVTELPKNKPILRNSVD